MLLEGGEREKEKEREREYRPRQLLGTNQQDPPAAVPCWSTKVWLFTSMCNKDVVPIEWFIGVMVVLM